MTQKHITKTNNESASRHYLDDSFSEVDRLFGVTKYLRSSQGRQEIPLDGFLPSQKQNDKRIKNLSACSERRRSQGKRKRRFPARQQAMEPLPDLDAAPHPPQRERKLKSKPSLRRPKIISSRDRPSSHGTPPSTERRLEQAMARWLELDATSHVSLLECESKSAHSHRIPRTRLSNNNDCGSSRDGQKSVTTHSRRKRRSERQRKERHMANERLAFEQTYLSGKFQQFGLVF